MWALAVIGCLLTAIIFLSAAYRLYRGLDDIPRASERATPEALGLNFQSIRLAQQGGELQAWVVPAEQPAQRWVLLVHGWGKDASLMLPLLPLLHDAGFNVLLMDASGHGQSDYLGYSNIARFAADMEAWLEWLIREKQTADSQLVIIAHSMAGGAAIWLSTRRKLAAVITINCYSHAAATIRKTMRSLHPVASRLSGWLVILWLQSSLGRSFDSLAPVNRIETSRSALLILHGEQDSLVDVAQARSLLAHAPDGASVKLILVPRAGHNSINRFARYAAKDMVEFINQQLPDPAIARAGR